MAVAVFSCSAAQNISEDYSSFFQEALAKEHDSFVVRYWASVINVVDEEVKEVLILLDYYKCRFLSLRGRHQKLMAGISDVCLVFPVDIAVA